MRIDHVIRSHLLAKIGVDTAENGPLKVCQNFEISQKLEKIRTNIGVQSIEKSRFCSVILFSLFGGTLHLLTLKQASNLVTYRYLSVNIYLAVKSVLFLYRQRGGDKFLKGGSCAVATR